ncbi:hypothetical protein BP6252_00087 [Coleophoma cylindrospora]|uniref:Uncharacterized protein n=1 Tax=Coleophoma cylindrospora TaxID=1849047 RepID=A0A3D8SP05_9HELO|nr:hypothetical protein BP6252_00087 [Coleophoma cylindrospora]
MDNQPNQFSRFASAADTGSSVVNGLLSLGLNWRIKELAATVSLSANLLSQAAATISKHRSYFLDTFDEKFECVATKCESDYLTIKNILRQLDSAESGTAIPTKPWKRFLWAVSEQGADMSDLEESLEKSHVQALMLQAVVSLIVLQIQAQERDLTLTEHHMLRRLKRHMSELLEQLRDSGVAKVIAFSLAEPTKVLNALQLSDTVGAEDDASSDAASTASGSITINNPSIISLPIDIKNVRPPPPPPPPSQNLDLFEIYRWTWGAAGVVKSKQFSFRMLGMSTTVTRGEKDTMPFLDKLPLTKDQINEYLEQQKLKPSPQTSTSPIDTILGVPSLTCNNIITLLNKKNEGPPVPYPFHRYRWAVDSITPLPEKKKSRFTWGKKPQEPEGFMIVLRGSYWLVPPPPPPPPRMPPPMLYPPHGLRTKEKEKKPATQIELGQAETEKAINDFLATLSTLYDRVSVEQRGAALRAIEDPGKYDTDYGSDSDSDSDSDTDSSGSGSLADD